MQESITRCHPNNEKPHVIKLDVDFVSNVGKAFDNLLSLCAIGEGEHFIFKKKIIRRIFSCFIFHYFPYNMHFPRLLRAIRYTAKRLEYETLENRMASSRQAVPSDYLSDDSMDC